MKEEIEDFIKDELSTKFNQRLYIDACINNIINTNKEYEQMLYNWNYFIDTKIRSNTGVNYFSQNPVVKEFLRKYLLNLFYNNEDL